MPAGYENNVSNLVNESVVAAESSMRAVAGLVRTAADAKRTMKKNGTASLSRRVIVASRGARRFGCPSWPGHDRRELSGVLAVRPAGERATSLNEDSIHV